MKWSIINWCVVLKNIILVKWEDLQDETKEVIDTVFKFSQNAFLLSFPFYFFTCFFLVQSFSRWLAVFVSLWVLIPFFEHYYVWVRAHWKEKV